MEQSKGCMKWKLGLYPSAVRRITTADVRRFHLLRFSSSSWNRRARLRGRGQWVDLDPETKTLNGGILRGSKTIQGQSGRRGLPQDSLGIIATLTSGDACFIPL